jgi:hypothetical protein
MPAYSSTSPPAKPGCPSSSRPTTSNQYFGVSCLLVHGGVSSALIVWHWNVNSKGIVLIFHIIVLGFVVDDGFGLQAVAGGELTQAYHRASSFYC